MGHLLIMTIPIKINNKTNNNFMKCFLFNLTPNHNRLEHLLRICKPWVQILRGFNIFIIPKSFKTFFFYQILQNLNILNPWKHFNLMFFLSSRISTGVPYHLNSLKHYDFIHMYNANVIQQVFKVLLIKCRKD